jgi:hypothetical protein
MPILKRARLMPVATCGLLALLTVGCCKDKCAYMQPLHPAPLGTISDQVWRAQETNAEASDFVIHEHEFSGNTSRLNSAGESHVRQVAARMDETPFPVIIELSSMSRRDGTKHGYPVHGDPELDKRRRELIVHTLTALGAQDVDNRVIVGPALTPGFEQSEGETAYYRGINAGRNGGGGGRGGFGGGGGGGFGR